MSAPSPLDAAVETLTFRLTVDGVELDSTFQVQSIEVWSGVNRIPRARIAILDGDAASENFPISETDILIPGAFLAIELGYGATATQVFSGVICKHGLETSKASNQARLVIEATDRAMVMTLARRNAVFEQVSDSDVMEKLICQAGLTADVERTSLIQQSIIQYDASDWDMMLLSAQKCGMLVAVADGKVTVSRPDMAGKPALTLTYGESIFDFRAEADATSQFTADALTSYSWDSGSQSIAVSAKPVAGENGHGNLTSQQLSKTFGLVEVPQQTAASLPAGDLTTWSTAALLRSRLAKIRGEMSFQGSALVTPGCTVELKGLGDRFNGLAFVSAVRHTVVDGIWTTQVEIGMAPNWFDASDIASLPAAGLLPPIANLQTGVVRKIDGDPANAFRVQVELPLLRQGGGVWARLANGYASDNAGAVFFPEIGDEVVVAFMNNDPRFPVVVGSLFSQGRPAPLAPDSRNSRKGIVTREGLRIDFFDDDRVIEISTPLRKSIRFDDKSGQVTITDGSGNTVTLAENGVTIDSASGISLNAKADITIAAQGVVSIKGTGGIKLAGTTIDARADRSFTADGAMETTISSNGILTLKGSMVEIN